MIDAPVNTTATILPAAGQSRACYKYPPSTGPLGKANQEFHVIYDELVRDMVMRLGHDIPLIVLTRCDLTTMYAGQQRSEQYLPIQFHALKAVSHLAFGVQLVLMANGEGALKYESAVRLRNKLRLTDVAVFYIAQQNLPPEIEHAQMSILAQSRQIIKTTLNQSVADMCATVAFAREIAPNVLRCAAYAARLEFDGIHQVVSRWRKRMTDAAWQALYVVVCGGHQQRSGHTAKQYFQHLFNEVEGTGAEREERVIYGEGLADIASAKDLLARHIIDQQASQMMFSQRRRLQRDVLADAATEYLNVLLPDARSDTS